MKKAIIFAAMLLVVSAASFSQQTNPSEPLNRNDYLKKSKKQKTAAWILAGSGMGLVVAAIVTTSVNDVANAIVGDDSGLNTGTTLFVIGGISALGSIPFFIASAKNKKRGMAASAFLKMENVSAVRGYSMIHIPFPTIAIKLSL